MKIKRTFVIGDIHGGYKALKQVLQRAKINSKDKLIFVGDYVDGWGQSDQVIDKLIALNRTNSCLFLRGNHDALFQDWLETDTLKKRWLINGGQSTITAYNQRSSQTIETHLKFIKQLKNYYIDDKNRLFLHAGFTNLRGPENEYYDYVYYWDRTLWETALATDKSLTPDSVYFPKRFTHCHEIFIGHTPTTRIGEDKPTKALNLWNCDTGAAFKGRLSMLDIETKEVYQSDPVFTLYPEENGRN